MANTNKCDPIRLKPGEWLSGEVYYKVEWVSPSHVSFVDNFGQTLRVSSPVVAREMHSAAQIKETKKVTRTEMAKLLMDAKTTVFTVTFEKKLTAQKVMDSLSGYKADEPARKRRKVVTDAMKGEVRVLTGYLKDCEPFMGRSTVYDLNIPMGKNERQVDHRTLQELIIRNVKYVLKGKR